MKKVIAFVIILFFCVYSCSQDNSPTSLQPNPILNGTWNWSYNPGLLSVEGINLMLNHHQDSLSGTAEFYQITMWKYSTEVFKIIGIYKYPDIEMYFDSLYYAKGKVDMSSDIELTIKNLETNQSEYYYFRKTIY